MMSRWGRPPTLLVLLYGLGTFAAIVFPLWRFLSTGELNRSLLISGIGVGFILMQILAARWQDNEYIDGIARFLAVLFLFLVFGFAGSTDGRVVILALLLALLFSGLPMLGPNPAYFHAAVVLTFLYFVYFIFTL